jgi:FkbM family methyltransferase
MSAYGPLLRTRKGDRTFRFCADGSYGFFLSDLLDRQNRPFSFIDVGANIGIYSLIAARNPQCQQCYAFEPNKDVFEYLKANIALNSLDSKIKANNVAISDKPGQRRFRVAPGHSGAGAISGCDGKLAVETTDRSAFNDIAATNASPQIVKIDVEGHEPIVIDQLMRSDLWQNVDTLFFESSEDRFEVNPIKNRLVEAGFRLVAKNAGLEAGVFDLLFSRAK